MFNNRKFTIGTLLILLAAALLGEVMINSQSFVVFAQAAAVNDLAQTGPYTFHTPTPPARVRRPTATKTRRPTVTRTKTVAPTRTRTAIPTRTRTLEPTRTKTVTLTAIPCIVTTPTEVCFDCASPHSLLAACPSSTAIPTRTATATFTSTPCDVIVTPTPCFDCSVPHSASVTCPSTATPTPTRTATSTLTDVPCEVTVTPTPCFDCSVPHFTSPTCPSTPTATLTSVPGAEFTGQPVSGVAPLTVHFTALNASILSSCTWTFGDGTSQTLTGTFSVCPSVDHVYDTSGSFTVTLSVIKATGASNSMTKVNYIVVAAPPTIIPNPTDVLPTLTPTDTPTGDWTTPTGTPTEICWDC